MCTDNVAVDGSGFATCNPLFMKYTPTAGKFSGQQGYGYRSFEAFIDTVASINAGETTPAACDEEVRLTPCLVPTCHSVYVCTLR